jgi:hypothetical protein
VFERKVLRTMQGLKRKEINEELKNYITRMFASSIHLIKLRYLNQGGRASSRGELRSAYEILAGEVKGKTFRTLIHERKNNLAICLSVWPSRALVSAVMKFWALSRAEDFFIS